jgi:hypothetical protein
LNALKRPLPSLRTVEQFLQDRERREDKRRPSASWEEMPHLSPLHTAALPDALGHVHVAVEKSNFGLLLDWSFVPQVHILLS